jgi:hypothetical protein
MALGFVLCLLAAVFAVEAKLAWYIPAGTPSAQISAEKLQRADASKLIAQALTSPAASQHFPAEAPLLAIALQLALPVRIDVHKPGHHRTKVRATFSFSPPLFRRPPPQI